MRCKGKDRRLRFTNDSRFFQEFSLAVMIVILVISQNRFLVVKNCHYIINNYYLLYSEQMTESENHFD